MEIEIGQRLLHYRLVDKIGEGGMGVVYVAEDTKLHRRVALKVLPEAMAADPERRARFQREAQAVAALNHPNIVTLHSVEEAPSTPSTSSGPVVVHFITMELIEGQNLSRVLPRNGFDPGRLLEIAIPLADAVSQAHRAGITHRDLKPDNIMFDEDGRLRVLDFGLAKLSDPAGSMDDSQAATVTSDGRILGTVAYMSPEQAEGKSVDPRSDVFSLGTILYEMASGERPFRGETSMSTIGSILKDEPISVTELNESLPRHLARIIHRCLAKDPDRRYQSALDLRNELEDLKAEIASGEHTEGRSNVAARSARSMRPLALLGTFAVVAIVSVFAITLLWRSDPPAAGYTSRPLTSAIGWEADINWSPEAEFITFGQMRDGNLDVMVQPVTGGQAVVRAGGPGDETSPRWSPDGKYIAYVSSSEPGSFIYLVPPHTGAPRKLINTDIPTLDIEKVSSAMGDRPWSHDSKTLLVSRITDTGQAVVFRVDRENGEAEQLTFPPAGSSDLSASHSFDGERIVFQRRTDGRGALLTMPVTDGQPEQLLADEFDHFSPAWRPDNRHVVFRSTRGGTTTDIWEIDINGGSPWQVTFDSNEVMGLSVSSDNRIAYVPFWHDTFLFVVDVTTGERRQLTSHSKDNFGARFSPDGQSVAYHSTRTGNSEIFVHYLDGRPETQITDDPGWDVYADWSPDGEKMIFVSSREGGQFKIFIANSDGGGERLLIDQPVSLLSPWTPVNAELVSRWSPDGERIAFLVTGDETNALWTVRADGEDGRKLLENVVSFDWYLGNRRAIYTRRLGSESELVAVNLETGNERVLFVGPLMEMDVAPDGRAVSFCFGRGHQAMGLAILKLDPPSDPDGLPRAVGEPEYVVRTEGSWHVHNGGWSPDSKRMTYTQDVDYGDIYELVAR